MTKFDVDNEDRVPRRKDVAELAKVSPSTVSLVLNNTPGPRIPDSTRQRVIDAADELGYQPSAVARALVTGKTMTIGVVFHYIGNPFHNIAAEWLNGVWSVLRGSGYRLVIGEGNEESLMAGLYRERGVDGIILLVPPYDANDPEVQRMRKSNFPVVSIGAKCEHAVGDYVDSDNFNVALHQTERHILA
ncbi:MAG: LacI family DNA-binding transcriptional regulator, partial [Planctomycetes bacterium]|nr:LacI family DNA-binding transcriptional regulator [Planctomycetota bacterium]